MDNPGDPTPNPAAPHADRTSRPTRAQWLGKTLIGVDWGRRRIGLAIKPAGLDYALPRGVLSVDDPQQAVEALRDAIRASGAEGVVVGLPHHPNPAQAQEIRAFCRKTRRPMRGVRWFFVDERLTSETARTLEVRRRSRRQASDDLAAMLILETFWQTLA